jgi:uncharacterized repeat protein (TIGR03803 family)
MANITWIAGDRLDNASNVNSGAGPPPARSGVRLKMPEPWVQCHSQISRWTSMIQILNISARCVLGCGLALAMSGALDGAAAKSNETVLYSFKGGSDGIYPSGSLLRDSAGNFYGTTYQGGIVNANGYGTVFKLAPDGTETVLYAFAGVPNDGANPNAGLIEDKQGNLYGTAEAAGSGAGIVFKVAPNGAETVLYFFCSQTNCTDGAFPEAGLIVDSAGNFYSTTQQGGANGRGTVFKLAPDGTETVLYSFCAQTNCPDGSAPEGGLVVDKKGNLYGTTYEGGASDYGTVFKLAPDGTETVLHSFASGSSDGAYPVAGLILKGGKLYGTTYYGGTNGSGTVFEVTTGGTETVLHIFTGSDGTDPEGGLIEDSTGNFYGTTRAGGANGGGTAFELAPGGTVTELYSFTGGSDGGDPVAGLIMKGAHLYGTTSGGGASNYGTVFEVKK